MLRSAFFAMLAGAVLLPAAEYQVGVATAVITPHEPIYLSGYGGRDHPSEGVIMDLKAKALVIRDKGGSRVAIVTMDLIGIPRGLSDMVAARVEKQYGIPRSHLVLNASHTHTGPLLAGNLETMFELSPQQRQVVDEYSRNLADTLVNIVGAAAGKLEPANLWFGNGTADFAINRREPTPEGVKIGLNPAGPTDHDVPVLKITGADGKLRVVLFGYACHNTTLTALFYKLSGDYAGFAQQYVEKAQPNTVAMFMELCGGDQNPNPRSKLEYAEQHGKELGTEVVRVAGTKLQRVSGPIRAAFRITDLAFAHHTRSTFEERLNDKNVYRVRNARNMLKAYDENRPVRSYPYPVQALSFGKDLTMVALGGEVVVDYSLRVKKEYGAKGLIVAGYSNDVMSYIPSKRILDEGGYEADDSMVYYGQPGRYRDDVEERIFESLADVLKRVGRAPAR
ncbi:MAG TPA: neutral/alkaline non-lysosomal ceramidase N-terminal domain-containing protein [Bryobacteraceae bacterium]|nr:neutral/alkaline non-lysosomal ceramidase N-terminal domain-containing protein [Bryobacteraceae bacterium]